MDVGEEDVNGGTIHVGWGDKSGILLKITC